MYLSACERIDHLFVKLFDWPVLRRLMNDMVTVRTLCASMPHVGFAWAFKTSVAISRVVCVGFPNA